MPRGGRREGAGRKPGVPQRHPVRKRQAVVAMEAGAAGLTPVDYLLGIMRNDELDLAVRLDAAKAVAPYVHPRLAVIDSTTRAEVSTSTLTKEERRERARRAILEAFAERPLKLIEGEVVEGGYKVIAGTEVSAVDEQAKGE